MTDRVIEKTKRGDSRYNVLVEVDGERTWLLGVGNHKNATYIKKVKYDRSVVIDEQKAELNRYIAGVQGIELSDEYTKEMQDDDVADAKQKLKELELSLSMI